VGSYGQRGIFLLGPPGTAVALIEVGEEGIVDPAEVVGKSVRVGERQQDMEGQGRGNAMAV
jgi:hypothetical protein